MLKSRRTDLVALSSSTVYDFVCAPTAIPTPIPTSLPSISPTSVPPEHRVLCDVYYSTKGSLKSQKWSCGSRRNPLSAVCDWNGVLCQNGNVVVKIALNSFDLVGTLPSTIGQLTALSSFDVSNNHLTGSLPSSIGMLSNMMMFNLGHNSFSESIPSDISKMKNLISIQLNNNNLESTIPSVLGDMTKMSGDVLLSHNGLTGIIPSSFGKLRNIKNIKLAYNSFEGIIPTTLGFLKNMTGVMDLNNNHLEGTLPDSLKNLIFITGLSLASNSFTGSIPSSYTTLKDLIVLDMRKNMLSGSIPSNIGDLVRLEMLSLQSNSLVDVIPESIGTLSRLTGLFLQNNVLNGSLPNQLANIGVDTCDDCELTLKLGYNQFTGVVPSFLGSLRNLVELSVGFNSFGGTIPLEFGELKKLRVLDILYNKLEGTIPSNLSKISSLEFLYLSYNQLTGVIPESFSNLKNLTELSLSSNFISGSIPQLSSSLKALYLHLNSLEGGIPSSFSLMNQLQYLHLSTNVMTGVIPSYLGNLTDLVVLSVAGNSMNGSIPSELGDLLQTQYMFLSYNSFTGILPDSLCKLSELLYLTVVSNSISCYDVCFSSEALFLSDFLGIFPVCHTNASFAPSDLLKYVSRQRDYDYSADKERYHLKEFEALDDYTTGLCNLLIALDASSRDSLETAGWACRNNIALRPCRAGQSSWGQTIECEGSTVTAVLLSNRQMSGSIPSSLGLVSTLKIIDLSDNRLKGTVPSELGQLLSMTRLSLNNNQFTGTIPTTLGFATSLKELQMQHNSLSGIVPSALCSIKDLTSIRVLPSNITCYEGCFLSPSMTSKGLTADTLDDLSKLKNCTKLVDSVSFAPSIYTSYSKCGASISWTGKDFCDFYKSTECPAVAVETYNNPAYDCPPSCLTRRGLKRSSAASEYCQTFALFALGCEHTGKSMSDVSDLLGKCRESYSQTLGTKTALKFALEFNITGILEDKLELALSNPRKRREARKLISLALASASGMPAVDLIVTNINVGGGPSGNRRNRALSSALGVAIAKVEVRSEAEAYGAYSDTARAAAHLTRIQLKRALSLNQSESGSDSLFSANLKEFSTRELDNYFVLKSTKNVADTVDYITAETFNNEVDRIDVQIEYSQTSSPTVTPTLKPTSPPSTTPSVQPSAPSVTPSAVPSTLAPTQTYSQLTLSIEMRGIGCASFIDVFMEALREAIAIHIPISLQYVGYPSCILSNYSTLTIPISGPFAVLQIVRTRVVNDSLSDSSSFMLQFINSVANKGGDSSALAVASVGAVYVTDTTPTATPIAMPTVAPSEGGKGKGKGKGKEKGDSKKGKDGKKNRKKDSKGKEGKKKTDSDDKKTKRPNHKRSGSPKDRDGKGKKYKGPKDNKTKSPKKTKVPKTKKRNGDRL